MSNDGTRTLGCLGVALVIAASGARAAHADEPLPGARAPSLELSRPPPTASEASGLVQPSAWRWNVSVGGTPLLAMHYVTPDDAAGEDELARLCRSRPKSAELTTDAAESPTTCQFAEDWSASAVRVGTGLSYGVLGIDLDVVRAVNAPRPYTDWSAGLRVATNADDWISVEARLAYLARLGAADGRGARASATVALRPFARVTVLVEATADATSVNGAPAATGGALLAWSTALGAGLRFDVFR